MDGENRLAQGFSRFSRLFALTHQPPGMPPSTDTITPASASCTLQAPGPPAQTLAIFAALQARALVAGVTLRAPPPPPTTCYGRGCNGCVWEGFYEAAAYWREDAEHLLACATGNKPGAPRRRR